MFKGSISLKKRDEHNKKKPMDDSFYPPSSHEWREQSLFS